ncbi:MAG: helix-turn-helix domain-containing protein [Clostridia bacterium]|nr:helix-turn-helix domain-containing protein [Clostridia bacterium]
MGAHYSHLTLRERITIEMRIKDGRSEQEIADELGRHVSTI